jgi:hypothetical protein
MTISEVGLAVDPDRKISKNSMRVLQVFTQFAR